MGNRKYAQTHIDFLAANIEGCPYAELTEKFNSRFGMAATVNAIIGLTHKHGLHNGIDARLRCGNRATQFPKGHVPFNKGKKKYWVGGEETQFKKGRKPWNYKPIGTERVNADGYVDIKIADPNRWRAKHVLLWEEAHGPVPRGHALVFADGNKLHVTLDNLILVTRGQLARLNQNHLIQSDPELTRSGVILADIITKCAERSKKPKGRRKHG